MISLNTILPFIFRSSFDCRQGKILYLHLNAHCHLCVHIVTLLAGQLIPETKMHFHDDFYFGAWVSRRAPVWEVLVQFWPPTAVLRLCAPQLKALVVQENIYWIFRDAFADQ